MTTKAFLSQFGLNTLRDLPDIEALEDAGLLSRENDFAKAGSDSAAEEAQHGFEADEEPTEPKGVRVGT